MTVKHKLLKYCQYGKQYVSVSAVDFPGNQTINSIRLWFHLGGRWWRDTSWNGIIIIGMLSAIYFTCPTSSLTLSCHKLIENYFFIRKLLLKAVHLFHILPYLTDYSIWQGLCSGQGWNTAVKWCYTKISPDQLRRVFFNLVVKQH